MFRQYREIRRGEMFDIFADPAVGGVDYCAVQFLSHTHKDIPLVYHRRILATEMTNEIHPVIERIFDVTQVKPMVAYERNNGGVFEMERLASLNRKGKYDIFKMPTYGKGIENTDAVKLGWETNSATRQKMLSDGKEWVDKRLLTIYDRMTIEELFSFVVMQTSTSWKAQAENGAHDDLVMSLFGAIQLFLNHKEPLSASGAGPFEEYKSKVWRQSTPTGRDETLGI